MSSSRVEIEEVVQALQKLDRSPPQWLIVIVVGVMGFMAATLFGDLRAAPESLEEKLTKIETTVTEIRSGMKANEVSQQTMQRDLENTTVLLSETAQRTDALEFWAAEQGYRPARDRSRR